MKTTFGKIAEYRKQLRMKKEIEKLSDADLLGMKYVVLGEISKRGL